ncbi:MAG: hypothetical protein MZV64_26665 [Ignavibacteriales bacterium]|nr:hypothetical protein [Ignavibacteriales bacterium]
MMTPQKKLREIKAVKLPPGMVAVKLNGKEFHLLDHGKGITPELQTELKTQSAKRILGLGNKKQTPPQDAWVCVPSAEVRDFTNAGGLSVVPRELVPNLIAMTNNKQNVHFTLETPLYTGRVNKSLFYELYKK